MEDRKLIDRYVTEINRHPLLSRKGERELADRLAATGDQKYAKRLALANLRFVVKIAHEYRRYGFPLLDLIQEGNVGLLTAVNRFDPDRGYRLNSYAIWWIRAYMQAFVMRNWSLVKIGTTETQRRLFFRLRNQRKDAAQQAGGEDVDPEGLAKSMGVATKEVVSMEARLAARDFSLDATLSHETQQSHMELLPDPGTTPEDNFAVTERRHFWHNRLEAVAAELDERERYILEQRLRCEDPQPLWKIGERFNISRERVRQLESRLVGKLRTALGTAPVEHLAA